MSDLLNMKHLNDPAAYKIWASLRNMFYTLVSNTMYWQAWLSYWLLSQIKPTFISETLVDIRFLKDCFIASYKIKS